MIAYFDTSALMKLVFDEPGSELAAEVWESAVVAASSHLLYAEMRAASAAAQRGGRINSRGLRRVSETIDSLYDDLEVIALGEDIARRAGDLAELYEMRGADAVHLATALGIDTDRVLMVTWDRRLAIAALACGCRVTPPA